MQKNIISNSYVVVGGNLIMTDGDIFNDTNNNASTSKSISMWDIVKKEYPKRSFNNFIDIFLWDYEKGQLSHFTIKENRLKDFASYNEAFNNQEELKLRLKLVPIEINQEQFIEPILEDGRRFSFEYNSSSQIKFSDLGDNREIIQRIPLRKKKFELVKNEWKLEIIDSTNWYELIVKNLRLNILFNSEMVDKVFLLKHTRRHFTVHYILIKKK